MQIAGFSSLLPGAIQVLAPLAMAEASLIPLD
jgi:hypothetical protein